MPELGFDEFTDALADYGLHQGYTPEDPAWQQMLGQLHEPQKEFVIDGARRKCALAGRRAGKSHGVAYWLIQGWQWCKGQKSVFIARSLGHARDILWDVLKELNETWRLGATFNESRLVMTFPNRYEIRLKGCENLRQAEKVRGPHYRRAVIDECHTFPDSLLRHLIVRVLEPALMDLQGELVLAGTPGYDLTGFWYEKTLDAEEDPETARATRFKQWPTHRWTCLDNVHLPDPQGEIDRAKEEHGWDDDHPDLVREYYGRWVKDDSSLVYPYDPEKNLYWDEDVEPWTPGDGTKSVIGVDVGWDDGCGFNVSQKRPDSPEIRIPVSYSMYGLTDHQIAGEIKKLQRRFKTQWVFVDSKGNKITAMTMRNYGIPAEAAIGGEKRPRIEYVRGLMQGGNLKAHAEHAQELIGEWTTLPWGHHKVTKKKIGHREGYVDENCDALLSGILMHSQKWAEKLKKPEKGTPEYDALVAKQERDKAAAWANKAKGKRSTRRAGTRLL